MARDENSVIRQFIVDNFLFGDGHALQPDTSFIENGILDSTGVLELVNFIETRYKITVQDEELIPRNLDSINNICQFLGRKFACAE